MERWDGSTTELDANAELDTTEIEAMIRLAVRAAFLADRGEALRFAALEPEQQTAIEHLVNAGLLEGTPDGQVYRYIPGREVPSFAEVEDVARSALDAVDAVDTRDSQPTGDDAKDAGL